MLVLLMFLWKPIIYFQISLMNRKHKRNSSLLFLRINLLHLLTKSMTNFFQMEKERGREGLTATKPLKHLLFTFGLLSVNFFFTWL